MRSRDATRSAGISATALAPLNDAAEARERERDGSKAMAFDDLDQLVAAIVLSAQPGDHVVVMSNGGFGGIHDKLLDALGSRASRKAAH